ncbi:MAG: hypothetical protein AcusKO_22000 [Acuticoccus sp.]
MSTIEQHGDEPHLNPAETKYCPGCGKALHVSATSCPECGASFTGRKNKVIAALLAIFLGTFGIHKFYLGRTGWGIVYLIFFWTMIPGFVGFIEGIIYLCMSDERFTEKYG